MPYKQGFLCFLVLALVLVFGGIVPTIASGPAPVASCSVAGITTGDPDDLPIIRVFNQIVGGSATSSDFTINVADDSGVQTQSGSATGNVFTVESGSFQVNTSRPNYVIEKPVCLGGNQISNGQVVTYTMVSTSKCAKANVNGDGAVNADDYSFVRDYIGCAVNSGNTGCDKSDVNGDGKVNTSDFVAIRGQIGCSL